MGLFGRPSQRDEIRAVAYRDWFRRQHPLALASVVLGVFSLVDAGVLILPEIASVVLGLLALSQLATMADNPVESADPPARSEGRWLACAGIVLGMFSLAVAIVLYFDLFHVRR